MWLMPPLLKPFLRGTTTVSILLWKCVLIKTSTRSQLGHQAFISKYSQVSMDFSPQLYSGNFLWAVVKGTYKATQWRGVTLTCKWSTDDCPHYWCSPQERPLGKRSQFWMPTEPFFWVTAWFFMVTMNQGADSTSQYCLSLLASSLHRLATLRAEVDLWPMPNTLEYHLHCAHDLPLSFACVSFPYFDSLSFISFFLLSFMYCVSSPESAGNNEKYN